MRFSCIKHKLIRGARWLSGRASDSGARGLGFETYLRRVMSLRKTLYNPKELVIPRKLWLRPDMTEKLLTGTLSLNTNKQTDRTAMSSEHHITYMRHRKTRHLSTYT